MPKKKHKKHPGKSAEAKNKNAPKDEHLRQAIRSAVTHAFSNGWVQNSGVAFLLAIVALAIAMVTNSQVKAAAIGFAAVGTLALWILAVVVVREASDRGIVITTKVSFVSTTGKVETAGPTWIKYLSPLGCTLSPLPVSLYALIHNSQSIPLKVDRIRASMQAKGSKWLDLTQVDAGVGQIFWIFNDIRQARPMNDNSASLDFTLRKPIPANSPVEGWLFFSTREEYPHSVGTLLRMRFVLTDTSGKLMEFTTPFDEIGRNVPPSDSGSGGVFMSVGAVTDLSSCRYAQFWAGGVIPVPGK